MKKCYECGKELKFWQAYRHPVLGKKEVVCSKCFDVLTESLKKYRDFILKEFGNNSIIKFKRIVH